MNDTVTQVMSERCIYGGLLATRGEVYADLSDPRLSERMRDRLTWMPDKATDAEIEALTAQGMTLKAFRAAEKARAAKPT